LLASPCHGNSSGIDQGHLNKHSVSLGGLGMTD